MEKNLFPFVKTFFGSNHLISKTKLYAPLPQSKSNIKRWKLAFPHPKGERKTFASENPNELQSSEEYFFQHTIMELYFLILLLQSRNEWSCLYWNTINVRHFIESIIQKGKHFRKPTEFFVFLLWLWRSVIIR